jgi:ABC-2 type transport system permease protein
MVQRILNVARREYVAYVRTKSFIISALALPVTLLIAIGLMALVESAPTEPRAFTILDETGRYQAALNADMAAAESATGAIALRLRDYVYRPPDTLLAHLPEEAGGASDVGAELRREIVAGRLFGVFLVRANPDGGTPLVDYYTSDPAADDLPNLVRRQISRQVALDRLLPLVHDRALVLSSLEGVRLDTQAVSAAGEEAVTAAHIARSYAPMAFVYLLWISIVMMASHLMTSTIEEKTSRIIEVMLSAVSPFEFMLGKLAGLAGAGLTMIGAWVAAGIVAVTAVNDPTVHLIGQGVLASFSGITPFWFLTFFILGFTFYAALFIGIGSVCNTMREAQNLTQPLMFVIMIPIFLMFYVTNNPDQIVSVVASFFPPFTPFVIMNRIPASPPPPLWQILVAALLLLGATWLIVRAAAKVFRIGILMYGKPPRLAEILRWARQPE